MSRSRASMSWWMGRRTKPLSRVLASLLSACLIAGTSPFAFAEGLSDDGGTEAAIEETVPVEEAGQELPVVDEGEPEESADPADPELGGDALPEGEEPVIEEVVEGEDPSEIAPDEQDALPEAEQLPEPAAEVQEELDTPEAAEGSMLLPREDPPADPVPDGFTAGPNELLAYRIDSDQRVDVRGLFDGRWISSTYGNGGYRPVIRIGEDSSAAEGASNILGQTGLVVTALPSFSEDGRAIFLRYSIAYPEGSASDAIGFDFAIAGDIKIGGDDSADVMLMENGRGFYMTSSFDVDANGTPASLAIYFSNTAGVDEPTAVWIGDYGMWRENFFSDQREGTEDVDSAFSISWHDLSLQQGESLTRGAASAVGELAEQALPEPEPIPEPEPEPAPEPAPAPEPEKPAPIQQASAKAAMPATGDVVQNPLPLALLGAVALLAGGALAVLRKDTDR